MSEITRVKKEFIEKYYPMEAAMSLDRVATWFAVAHHECHIVRELIVDEAGYLPVKVRYLLPVWREVQR